MKHGNVKVVNNATTLKLKLKVNTNALVIS